MYIFSSAQIRIVIPFYLKGRKHRLTAFYFLFVFLSQLFPLHSYCFVRVGNHLGFWHILTNFQGARRVEKALFLVFVMMFCYATLVLHTTPWQWLIWNHVTKLLTCGCMINFFFLPCLRFMILILKDTKQNIPV